MDDVERALLRDAERPYTAMVRRLLQVSYAVEDRLRATGDILGSTARRGHYVGRVGNIVFDESGIGPEDARPRKTVRCRSNPQRWA